MQANKEIKFNPKTVIKEMKCSQRRTFVYSLNLALATIAVFAGAIFFTRNVLYLLIPFILIPWAYASTMMILDKNANDESAPSMFFASFSYYYRNGVFGSYRLIRNYFVGLLVSLFVSFITGAIYYFIAVKAGGELSKLLSQAYFYLSNGDMASLKSLLSVESSLTKMIETIFAVEFVIFFLIFLHSFGVYGINALSKSAALINSPTNRLFSKVVRTNWKEFFKIYYGMLYPLLIIETIGGVGGYFLSTLISSFNLEQRIIFAIGVAIVLLSMCFGYYVHALALMENVYAKMVVDFLMKSAEDMLSDPEFLEEFNENEQNEIKENFEELKKIAKQEKNHCDFDGENDNDDIESEDD